MLSEKDIELLKKAIEQREKYKISVDNDVISVYEEVDDDDDDDDGEYETFENFGQDFIVDLLQYLGADADYC